MAESGELAEMLGARQPAAEELTAKQELQADPQQSPPMQIEN
jgi:hypothetical protein